MKKIMVVGSSGFVGNYIMKSIAKKNPQLLVVGMSRSGRAREEETHNLPNVSYVKGDCLEPESFRDHLSDVDGVIHCVGTLIEKRNNPKLTYDAMNRDAAINVAAELNDYAEERKEKRQFVYISSEKAPPFLDRYLTAKLEAEKYILEECPNLQGTMIRPGFIVDKDYRWWSVPLGYAVDLAWYMNEKICKPLPFANMTDFLFPAKSVKLSTVSHFAEEGVFGQLGD